MLGRREEERVSVTEGSPAPDFTLTADDGRAVTLSALRGRPVVLFFYPKDNTPGCARQACGIRDAWGDFERAGAHVLGVSVLDERSKARFKDKHGLPFTLLADPDHEVAEAYGVWVEKRNYGKTYHGIERTTFVIDAAGDVVHVLHRVTPDDHAAQVLGLLDASSGPRG
jgi:peroxiredoxin Q/BCP